MTTIYECPARGGVDENPENLCPREEITNLCCASCERLCGGEFTCLRILDSEKRGETPVSCGIPVTSEGK